MPRTGRPPGLVPYYQPADVVERPRRKSGLTPSDIQPLPMPADAIDLIAWASLPRRKASASGSVVLPVALRALLVHLAVRQGEIVSLVQVQDILDVHSRSVYAGLDVLMQEGFIRNLHPGQAFVGVGKSRGRRYAICWQKLRESAVRNRVPVGGQYTPVQREPRRRAGPAKAMS